jgi:hypothetical protein
VNVDGLVFFWRRWESEVIIITRFGVVILVSRALLNTRERGLARVELAIFKVVPATLFGRGLILLIGEVIKME